MRIAIVCDDLIQFGGAEKLVMCAHEIWPQAPIYTSVASLAWVDICRKNNIQLKYSYLQHFPLKNQLNRFYAAFMLHALAFESFDFSEFDVVLSFSARYSHLIITKPQTRHISYINSPGRMFWESASYFEHGLNLKNILAPSLSYFRLVDFVGAQRADEVISNSESIRAKVKTYYKRDSKVIHPFVDYKEFENVKITDNGYYLVLSRLYPWKKIDVAIEAANTLHIPLKIAGTGPDLERLGAIAGPTVELLGYVDESKKIELLAGCSAFIVTQSEDFGIAPLEASACGKPVLAYASGGALETISQGLTGDFFSEQTPRSLAQALSFFKPSTYSPNECEKRAKSFDKSVFMAAMGDFVGKV